MLGGWKVEGVSELSDLILQSGEAPGINTRERIHLNLSKFLVDSILECL